MNENMLSLQDIPSRGDGTGLQRGILSFFLQTFWHSDKTRLCWWKDPLWDLCLDGSIFVQLLQHQRGECERNPQRFWQHHSDPGWIKNIYFFFQNRFFRRIPIWQAAVSGVTMTPSSKTLLSLRTIGFVGLATTCLTCTRLGWSALSWEPLCSGLCRIFFSQPNPLTVPSPTSLDGRRASTSGLSPWCSSPFSRSQSTTAMTCSPCSRWRRRSRFGAETLFLGSRHLWHVASLPVPLEYPLWDLWHKEQVAVRFHFGKFWDLSYDLILRGYVICFACLTWSLGQIAFPLVGENHFAFVHHNLANLIYLPQIWLQAGWLLPGGWSRLSPSLLSSSFSSPGRCSRSLHAGSSPSRGRRRLPRSWPRLQRRTEWDLPPIWRPDWKRLRRPTRKPPWVI